MEMQFHPPRVPVCGVSLAGTRLAIEDFSSHGGLPALPSGTGPGGPGYGLTGMKERAELLGGTLTAGPTDGGFLVELWAPA